MILRTVGCRWNRCTMCGYASEGAPASAQDLIAQFEMRHGEVLSGGLCGQDLHQRQLPGSRRRCRWQARDEILKRLEALGIKKLVIETRPEYVTPETVEICLSHLPTEFAIGLETSNDLIREHVIRKGFTFQDFVDASEAVHRQGGRVKAYLLLKPPLLSEGQAMRDAIASARAARGHADVLSLNLCNVQRNTVVERMWERGEFRPSLALVGPGGAKKRAGTDRLRSGGRRNQARPA